MKLHQLIESLQKTRGAYSFNGQSPDVEVLMEHGGSLVRMMVDQAHVHFDSDVGIFTVVMTGHTVSEKPVTP